MFKVAPVCVYATPDLNPNLKLEEPVPTRDQPVVVLYGFREVDGQPGG